MLTKHEANKQTNNNMMSQKAACSRLCPVFCHRVCFLCFSPGLSVLCCLCFPAGFLLVDLVRLSVPVPVIDWKDSSFQDGH